MQIRGCEHFRARLARERVAFGEVLAAAEAGPTNLTCTRERVCDAVANRLRWTRMDATVLDVLTALLSLVSAVGVLVVNGKVDRLTGRVDNLTAQVDSLTVRVDSLTARVERMTGRVDALEGTLHTVVGAVMGRNPLPGGPS